MASISSPAGAVRAPFVPIFVPSMAPFSRVFLVASSEPLIVQQHFFRRGYLCSGQPSCPFCRAGCGRTAYLWAASWDDGGRILLRLPYVADWVEAIAFPSRVQLKRVRKGGELLLQRYLFNGGDEGLVPDREPVSPEKLLQLLGRLFRLPDLSGITLADAACQVELTRVLDRACSEAAHAFASSRKG